MTISIDWAGTHVIYVPKADMVQIEPPPREVRGLNMQTFRMTLRDLEDDPDGRPWPKTHDHETESTLAGVVYARKVKILPPYTITFEDGQYAVAPYGANHNIFDVKNLNQVSLLSNNSAGLITVTSGSGVTEQDKLDIADRVCEEQLSGHPTAGSVAAAISGTKADTTELLARLSLARALALDLLPDIRDQATLARQVLTNDLFLRPGSTNNWILKADNGEDDLLIWHVTGPSGEGILIPAQVPARRILAG